MGKLQKISTLQVDQDSTFQKRNWRAQRVGWWGIALVLLAALLGVFGYGPISSASQSDAGATYGILECDGSIIVVPTQSEQES